MTYPDLTVATVLQSFFIPVQVNVREAKELVDRFHVVWTPNLNFMDSEADLFYRVEGWLPASEYVAMMMVAGGHFLLRRKEYETGIPFFQEVWDKYPHSTFAPEALYYIGVAKYLASGDARQLKEAWQPLKQFYPGSSWAIRSTIG